MKATMPGTGIAVIARIIDTMQTMAMRNEKMGVNTRGIRPKNNRKTAPTMAKHHSVTRTTGTMIPEP